MKTFILTICCFFTFITARAQTAPQPLTVKGIAVDSATLQPIGYATVALMDAATQKSVRGALTKDDGSFELKSVTGKAYQLVLAVVGYTTKTINIKASDADLNLGKISLSASKNQLKEVSVFAVRPILKREVDRISYDVQADPESVALTGLDMIRKVPLLGVDANENILLKGSGNYKILINGKESALVAKNPSDFLKAMPASNIEKIEVITTPPAKYDAEGLAGIINIVTKKNADQGYNANISGRYNSVYGPGLNLNANAKQGKFGLTMYVGGNRANPFTAASGNTENIFGVQTISQAGSGSNQFHNMYGDAELSYDIDTLNLLTASFQMYKGGNNQSSDQFSNAVNSDGSIAQQYNQASSGYNTWGGLDASINYQIGFKKSKDQLLTLSYKYSYSPNSQYNNNIFSQRLNFPGSGTDGQPDFYEYNNAGSKEHTIQVDYAQPFKKVTLEIGAKAILRNNFSDFNRSDLDSATNQYKLNSNFTDNFNYNQNVYSLYNSYQVKLEKWTGKVGLRLEHTTVNADFTTNDTTVHQSYNNLIPSISIQRTFKTSSFNLGFTQRIQRPGIYQLNPYIDNSDPKFISQGNPNLRPELNNSFELNYSNFSKNSFNAGLSYQFSNNAIQNVTNLLQQSDVSYTTYENLGSNKTLGFNVNTNIAITKKFTVNLNGQVSKVWLAANFNGQAYENTGFTGNAFGSMGYKFNDNYRLGIDAGYFSGSVNLQGSSSSFIYNAVVFTKTFLNKMATVSLVANCPEAKFHDNTSYNSTSQFYQYSYNENPYRTFAVRFSYKIGKLNSEIKKNQHGINNDDTKGGGKSGGNG
jgi:outer membrane receptor protein involved in Fe transport